MMPSSPLYCLVLAAVFPLISQAQQVAGRVVFADGSQLSGNVAFETAVFVNGKGSTDNNQREEQIYFRPSGSDLASFVSLRELSRIAIQYSVDGEYGMLRRDAVLEWVDGRTIAGSIPVSHEGPAGTAPFVYTRYIDIETSPLIWRRIELPHKESASGGERVTQIEITP
jgi:hypothetical protein